MEAVSPEGETDDYKQRRQRTRDAPARRLPGAPVGARRSAIIS
jgi:hypothetical protein